jgi:predicted HAD superfamily Cof-like phosphohydrolase
MYDMEMIGSEHYKMVLEFHETFGCAIDEEPTRSLRQARYELLDEETFEVIEDLYPKGLPTEEATEALWSVDPVAQKERLAKELCDILYVVFGTAIALGIDIDEAFVRVHRSNMSKVWDDYTVYYDENGKVLKPPTYQPPDMTGVAR